jgi:hypothetical protein
VLPNGIGVFDVIPCTVMLKYPSAEASTVRNEEKDSIVPGRIR